MRVLLLGTVCWLFVACQPSRRCVHAPLRRGSSDDRSAGIPSTIFQTAGLVSGSRDRKRSCQLLFEPAFSTRHAVWFTWTSEHEARVVVRLAEKDDVRELSAPLDGATARTVERACQRFLELPEPCPRLGWDGTWYHAAQYLGEQGYLMRTFWTPRRSTVDERFVAMEEALRGYVVVAPAFRHWEWLRLQRATDELERALDGG